MSVIGKFKTDQRVCHQFRNDTSAPKRYGKLKTVDGIRGSVQWDDNGKIDGVTLYDLSSAGRFGRIASPPGALSDRSRIVFEARNHFGAVSRLVGLCENLNSVPQARESDMIVNWLGVVIGILGIGFAFYERRQRTKMESVVGDTLRRLAGDIRVIFSNANWTDQHLRTVGHLFAEANPDFTRIRRETFDAARDAASCARTIGPCALESSGDSAIPF